MPSNEPQKNETTQRKNHQPSQTKSDYVLAKEKLSKRCDYLKYGSLERRTCRKELKQGFSKTCRSKTEMPKYLRNANCSLANSFPVVE